MDRWLHAQHLGVTASILVTHSGTHPAFRAARKILHADLTDRRAAARGFDFFLSLPPWVLAVLARAFRQGLVPKLTPFAVLAEEALRQSLIGWADETSTVARAQIWAYHALLSHTRADGLLRLGRTLFGHAKEWITIDTSALSREGIARSLALIRDPLLSTGERCQAIKKLAEILQQTPFWEQIENILYHNQFCWPLVVFDSDSAQGGSQDLALSLPVAVDIRFDNRSEIGQTTGTGALAPKWEKNLERAVHAAKTLWRLEHGNCGRFRDMVEAASVTLDFSVAEKIVEPLAQSLRARFSVSDRSAEAYFAEVVLGRLLGLGNVMVSAVTGVLGDQTKNNHQHDRPTFPVGVPQGMVEKIQYAAATSFFERIVLPEARESRGAAADSLKRLHLRNQKEIGKSPLDIKPLEVLYVEDFESVSDYVLPLGWRRHRYIRCPELEWAIHSIDSPGPMRASDDKRVHEVVARLASNTAPLFKLETSPMVVASALSHIDAALCRKEPESSSALSWAFINVSEGKFSVRWDDEKDIFFWELFFKAMGLGLGEFRRFLRRPSRTEAVKNLTANLNRFVPTPDQPHRCPDVIVLIGRQTLANSAGRSRTPSGRPFMVIPILEQLKDRLRAIGKPDDPAWRLIGNTRIIILPVATSKQPIREEVSLNDLTQDELRQLRHLSTLEGSFTEGTAGLLWSRSGVSQGGAATHEILEKFVRKGILRYVHGKYHVPSFVARQIPAGETSEDRVKRHYAAGAALAPYVIGGQGALFMAADLAFTPEYFEAANEHFRRALYYSRKTGSAETGRLRKSSEEAVRRLVRFIMPPSWATVSRLLTGANRLQGLTALEPYEKACDLLLWHEEARIPPHPFHLVTAASSAVRAASCISFYVDNPSVPSAFQTRCEESPLQLHAKAKGFHLKALQGCSLLPKNEREITRLFCLTKYLAYLCQRHWVLIGHEKSADREEKETEIRRIWSQILDLMDRRVKLYIADGLEGFERMGDREPDHKKALDIYLKGMQTGLLWSSLSLKAWGAASLCRLSERLNSMLKNFPAQEKGHLIYKAYYSSAERAAKASCHETLRTREGLRVFERVYANDPHVKAARAPLDRDYGKERTGRLAEREGLFLRGVVAELELDERQGFLHSPDGKRYRFHDFRLTEGLAYEDLSEGTEVDFRVLREGAEGRTGDAANLRKPMTPGESPVQKGKIAVLKPDGQYGFVLSEDKEYHFRASNLGEGLAYDDLREGMWVTFQIVRARPNWKSDEATNICPIANEDTSGVLDSSRSKGVRGTVSWLRPIGRQGFILSEGRKYHFHASHLAAGLEYDDIRQGMEIEFDIVRQATDVRCGQARLVRNIGDSEKVLAESADPRDGSIREGTEATPTESREVPTSLIRRGIIYLFKQEGRFGFLSANGIDYYFKESDLRGGLTRHNVYEGMEVEFRTRKEKTPKTAAEAMEILLREGIEEWEDATRFEFLGGTISFVKRNKNHGLIRSSDGQDYYFSGSDLREGLAFKGLYRGMKLEFQIRKAAMGNQPPAAMNVRPVPRSGSSRAPIACEPQQCATSRGSVSFIKGDGDYGFICSLSGRNYYFHESDLGEETTYRDLDKGMEVGFQILREGRPGRAGQAICVRPAERMSQEAFPNQRGVVYCLVPEMRCGFITTEDGEKYQFTESDLIGGMKYEDVRECMEVSFQIRSKPDSKAGKAVNVAFLNR